MLFQPNIYRTIGALCLAAILSFFIYRRVVHRIEDVQPVMTAQDTPSLMAALPVSSSKNQPPSPLPASNAFYRQLAGGQFDNLLDALPFNCSLYGLGVRCSFPKSQALKFVNGFCVEAVCYAVFYPKKSDNAPLAMPENPLQTTVGMNKSLATGRHKNAAAPSSR
jgi:hypothetical protein